MRTETYVLGYQGAIRQRTVIKPDRKGITLYNEPTVHTRGKEGRVLESVVPIESFDLSLGKAMALSDRLRLLTMAKTGRLQEEQTAELPQWWFECSDKNLHAMSLEELQHRVHQRRAELTLLNDGIKAAKSTRNEGLRQQFIADKATLTINLHAPELKVLRKRAKERAKPPKKSLQIQDEKPHDMPGEIVVFHGKIDEKKTHLWWKRGPHRPKDTFTLGLRMFQAGIADIRNAVKRKKISKKDASPEIRELQLREKLLRYKRGDFQYSKKGRALKPRWEEELRKLTRRPR